MIPIQKVENSSQPDKGGGVEGWWLKELPVHCTERVECGHFGNRRVYSHAGTYRVKGDGAMEGIRRHVP